MAKKMWGGRFKKPIDPLFESFSKSIQYDYKLAQYDLVGSMAHVSILIKAGYLNSSEGAKLTNCLKAIYKKVKAGDFKPDFNEEDIHTQIQNMLLKSAGDVALKLHTCRSRNDQVVFATKLYCKDSLANVQKEIADFIKALSETADKNSGLIIPGFTHLQHAQPVLLKDYLGAYIQMLKRDSARLLSVSKNMKLTMGAGALAGTPIDAAKYKINIPGHGKVYSGPTAKISDKSSPEAIFLAIIKDMNAGNIEPAANSLDTVSDRDFVIEIISALSILAMHMSRMAEDLILWSTKEFGFVELDDAYCTGSSLMPQKKNPDSLELIRGNAGRIYGNLLSVLIMMKGLPLTYNRDMQLDKEPLFNSFEVVLAELKILAGLIKTIKFHKEKIEKHLQDESLYATDLVYYLVDKGIAFKEAHEIAGKLVRYSQEQGISIKSMTDENLKEFSPKFVKKEISPLFDPVVSVRAKKSVLRDRKQFRGHNT
jgi:argininosuccinate lyase